MSGLGQKGQQKLQPVDELFGSRAHTQKNLQIDAPDTGARVRKGFLCSSKLSEQMRKYCYENNVKETALLISALTEFFENHSHVQ